jgi:hypothetical protein
VDTHGASFPLSEEAVLQDWRNFPLKRLKIFSDRCLGNLNAQEFAGLCNAPLLSRIRDNWDQADDGIRALYNAVMQRIEHERLEAAQQETVVEQKAAPRQVQPEELMPRRIQDSLASEPMRAPVERHQEPVARPDKQLQETSPEQKAQSSALMRISDSDEVLQRLDEANAALDAANTLEQVKELVDIASVAHIYARRAKKGALAENKAAAYVCRALAKLGRMMPASRAAGKLQKHGRPEKKDSQNSFSDSVQKPKTLAQLNISKNQATQARKLAKFSEPEFESRLKEKLDRLELSRTSTLQDATPKKDPEAARYFRALLKDIEKVPGNYNPEQFSADPCLLKLYFVVRERFLNFIDMYELAARASNTPVAK